MDSVTFQLLEELLRRATTTPINETTQEESQSQEVPLPPPPPVIPEQTPSSNTSTNTTQIMYQDLNDLLYMYNKTIQEHYQTLQRAFETFPNSRLNIGEIRNIMYYMNLNIQEYHSNMRHSIDILQQLYLNNSYSNNYIPRTAAPTRNTTNTTNTFSNLFSRQPNLFSLENPPRIRTVRNNPRLFDTIYMQVDRIPTTTQTQRLTETSINLCTETYRWPNRVNIQSSTTIDMCGNEISSGTCPISLEDFQDGDEICKIRICNHQFKKTHLLRWFQRNNKCPVCRRNVLDYLNNQRSVSNTIPRQPENTRQPNVSQELEFETETIIEPDNEETEINQEPTTNTNTRHIRHTSQSLNELIENELTNILQEYMGSNTTRSSNTNNTENIVEIFQDIIPIDLEYRIEFTDSSNNTV